MQKAQLHINKRFTMSLSNGFSLVELLVSISIFLVFVISMNSAMGNVTTVSRNATNRERAVVLAEEGLEATRNIRDANFSNLVDGTYGLSSSGGQWNFAGTSDITDIFTRQLTISTVNANQKQVNVAITWADQSSATNSVTSSTYFTNWRAILNIGIGLTVNKSVINHGGSKVASDFAPYKVGTTTVVLGQANLLENDTYTVSESPDSNYTQTFSGDCNSSGRVTMVSNTTKTCLITNEEKPSQLIVNKVVINHGGTKVASDFTLLVDTNPVTSGATNTFNSGLHTVSETVDPNYAGTFSGDCNSSGQVTLVPNTTKICTLTNEESVAYVTVNKTVVGGPLSISSFAPYKVGSTTVSQGVSTSMSAGTYTVSETTDSSYIQTFSGDCNSSGSITLVGGQSKVCTITNTYNPQGMLVYGNGGTTSDAVQYKIYNSDGTWGTAGSLADVDGATTNKALRAVRIYSSSTRNEKIAISRHYNGSAQFIYGQVYNGTTKTWGNVVQLSTWTAATYLDVQNFDGTYLANGNFMVIYSDNTVIPKMQTWNGTAWSGVSSLTTLGASQIPNYVVAKARSGTNEVMASFFTQNSRTISEYYSGSAWSAITSHSNAAANATQRFVDFTWSRNTSTTGMIVYPAANNSKFPTYKIWQANGSGSGTWGTALSGTTVAQITTKFSVVDRPGANEFQVCSEYTTTTPSINCDKVTFSGTTATLSKPTNSTIGATDNGLQVSYELGFESLSGTPAIIVYSDTTSTPKYKKYTASTNTWDVAATSIGAISNVTKSVRIIPKLKSDDMMILFADGAMKMDSVMWDGTNGVMYATPAGKALTLQASTGSAATDYWYDFTWD